MATSSEVSLTRDQRLELNSIAQSRSLPAGYVFRAKLILMLAEGASFNTIKGQLQTTAPTIIRWKQRFLESELDGLDTYHPGQKATVLTPALRARILSATRKKPRDGSTHWSCRKLAAALGVSKDAVHRVWQEAGLKPHRLERYLASDDPEFESKAADILGLYLNPPQHAAVFSVDEKTAIQALDRLDPVLPLSPGRTERHGFEYSFRFAIGMNIEVHLILLADPFHCRLRRHGPRRRCAIWTVAAELAEGDNGVCIFHRGSLTA